MQTHHQYCMAYQNAMQMKYLKAKEVLYLSDFNGIKSKRRLEFLYHENVLYRI